MGRRLSIRDRFKNGSGGGKQTLAPDFRAG